MLNVAGNKHNSVKSNGCVDIEGTNKVTVPARLRVCQLYCNTQALCRSVSTTYALCFVFSICHMFTWSEITTDTYWARTVTRRDGVLYDAVAGLPEVYWMLRWSVCNWAAEDVITYLWNIDISQTPNPRKQSVSRVTVKLDRVLRCIYDDRGAEGPVFYRLYG